MNRAILASSVIIGIAVMMSMSVIAPAFAASPWKDFWFCRNSDSFDAKGAEEYVKGQGDCGKVAASQQACDPSGPRTDGHFVFIDRNGDNIFQPNDEKRRCIKN